MYRSTAVYSYPLTNDISQDASPDLRESTGGNYPRADVAVVQLAGVSMLRLIARAMVKSHTSIYLC